MHVLFIFVFFLYFSRFSVYFFRAVCFSRTMASVVDVPLTEFEHETINDLINQGLIAFYCRYVDDTLLLIKRNTINTILEHFHKFDRNIRFTFDLFKNSTPHFLDINIASDGLGIYRKDTLLDSTLILTALYLGDKKSLRSEH